MSDPCGEAAAPGWSAVAEGWAQLWGRFAEPAWRRLADLTAVRAGSRVLDVGCGSGEFVAFLDGLGAAAAGADPEPGMVAIARSRTPRADLRIGTAEDLPWPDGVFDVVTAVNALQFAEDTDDALAELVRVAVPGGLVAVANWAESARSDLKAVDAALAAAVGEDVPPDGDLRTPGGLEELLTDGGLDVVVAGLVEVPWEAPDAATLVRAVLLGEDADRAGVLRPTVLSAARPFRTPEGRYRFRNAFRFAIGRTPQGNGELS